jgi:hypothetical protein
VKCPICESTELRVEVRFAGQVACKFVEGDNFELIEKLFWTQTGTIIPVANVWIAYGSVRSKLLEMVETDN